MNGFWDEVATDLSNTIGNSIQFKKKISVFGGDINQVWKVIDNNNHSWFVKTNLPSMFAMFEAEARGLQEIEHTHTVRTPKSYCYGVTSEFSYLVLEHIDLAPLKNHFQAGQKLAEMHLSSIESRSDKLFGWVINNTIGSTPQSNKQHRTWTSFYKQERLLFQLNLAQTNNYPIKSYEKGLLLAENLPYFFDRYIAKPSLLHGDLWGGNCASDSNGNTVIFDPAVYYGDRETDVAMTELFGGFNADFYFSYNNHFPLDQDYKTRKSLYNLYHILNHFNLFGGSYAIQAGIMTEKLLAEILE